MLHIDEEELEEMKRVAAAEELERLATNHEELREMFLTEAWQGLRAFSHSKLCESLLNRATILRGIS